jgi:hypothetical protein
MSGMTEAEILEMTERLKARKPLVKPHYLWYRPLACVEAEQNAGHASIWAPLERQMARICGGLGYSVDRGDVVPVWALDHKFHVIHHSPFFKKCTRDLGKADVEWALAISRAATDAKELYGHLPPDKLMLVFDHEWYWPDTPEQELKLIYRLNLAAKLFYDAIGVLPVWYNRGAMLESTGEKYGAWMEYQRTPVEVTSFPARTVTLYHNGEIHHQHESYRKTVANADTAYVSVDSAIKATIETGAIAVWPWLTFGQGIARSWGKEDDAPNWQHGLDQRSYAWQLGAEINRSWYWRQPDRFAPWDRATAVLIYWKSDLGWTRAFCEHFESYCRGAEGVPLDEEMVAQDSNSKGTT